MPIRSRDIVNAAIAIVLVAGAAAWAAESKGKAVPSAGMPAFVQDVPPAARAAVQVVDDFGAAIAAVKIDVATGLLDPGVLILESGGSERSRDEYLRSHALADAAFLQTASISHRFRKARVEGDLAWVATESLIRAPAKGKAKLLKSTETMVLRRTPAGWRIVHVHWSSSATGKE